MNIQVISISGIGSEITRSINERSRLSAQAYNTKKDFSYLTSKSIPKEAFYSARVEVMKGISEYKRLRACFDNYQDNNTLRNDKDIAYIVDCLNTQRVKVA
jgi:hypothetical protein